MTQYDISEQEILEAVVFVRHIKKHLRKDQHVMCMICKKTIEQIFAADAQELLAAEPEQVWIQMKRETSRIDPTCTVFTLIDPNNKCQLDRWEVRSREEHEMMMQDFYDLGLIKFDQLVSARGHKPPGKGNTNPLILPGRRRGI